MGVCDRWHFHEERHSPARLLPINFNRESRASLTLATFLCSTNMAVPNSSDIAAAPREFAIYAQAQGSAQVRVA
jgi:hypothetical protein